MKYFLLVISLGLVACGSDDKADKPVTNQEGQSVTNSTQALNGFWQGQFDQAGKVRFLIYNGDVYGLDEKNAFSGTVVLDTNVQQGRFELSGRTFSQENTEAKQFVAEGGIALDYTMELLLTTTQSTSDTLFGDFTSGAGSSSNDGSIQLTNDGTWSNNSSLSSLQGKWTASGFEMFIEQTSDKAVFKGTAIGDDSKACDFDGEITLINKDFTLYRVVMSERKNCTGFNTTDAAGYAAVNADKELEFYLQKSEAQLFMTFTPPSSSDSGASDDSSAAEESDTAASDTTTESGSSTEDTPSGTTPASTTSTT